MVALGIPQRGAKKKTKKTTERHKKRHPQRKKVASREITCNEGKQMPRQDGKDVGRDGQKEKSLRKPRKT